MAMKVRNTANSGVATAGSRYSASRAPAAWRGTMLGVEALAASAASLLSGYMGGWYEVMSPTRFWTINAMIVGGAGLAVLILRGPLIRFFGPETAEDVEPGPDATTQLA